MNGTKREIRVGRIYKAFLSFFLSLCLISDNLKIIFASSFQSKHFPSPTLFQTIFLNLEKLIDDQLHQRNNDKKESSTKIIPM